MAYTSSVICFHQRPLTLFASPGSCMQGPGATHELGRELRRLGLSGRVLFVAGRTAQRDLQPIWQQVPPEVGLEPVVIAFGGDYHCTCDITIGRQGPASRSEKRGSTSLSTKT
ncbi:MAG: hypothetical protein ACK5N0_07875 [Synechococcaceae cyanobacterium]